MSWAPGVGVWVCVCVLGGRLCGGWVSAEHSLRAGCFGT